MFFYDFSTTLLYFVRGFDLIAVQQLLFTQLSYLKQGLVECDSIYLGRHTGHYMDPHCCFKGEKILSYSSY